MSRRRLARWMRIAREDPTLVPRIVVRKARCGRGLQGTERRTLRLGSIAFEVDPALGEMARAMYCGLYEMRVLDAVRRLLRPGDTFLDIGANVGYHTAVAADLVGPGGTVYAFEPVAIHFSRLVRLARANPGHRIVPVHAAAGERAGEATISIAGASNAGWNTLVPNHMPPERRERSERVPVVALDDFLEGEGVRRLSLVKIDVEGFELPVLRGMRRFLETTAVPPPILCEVAPRAYPLIDSTLGELEQELASLGYGAFDLRRPRRRVSLPALQRIRDVLLLPDAAHARRHTPAAAVRHVPPAGDR